MLFIAVKENWPSLTCKIKELEIWVEGFVIFEMLLILSVWKNEYWWRRGEWLLVEGGMVAQWPWLALPPHQRRAATTQVPPWPPSYTVGSPPPTPPQPQPPLQITAARAASNLHTTPAVQKRCPREFIVLAKYDSGELMIVKASEKTKNYEYWDVMMCLLSTYKSILWK